LFRQRAQIAFELVSNDQCSQGWISALPILAIANRFLPAPPGQAHACGARLIQDALSPRIAISIEK
jgi:hypothetical protein